MMIYVQDVICKVHEKCFIWAKTQEGNTYLQCDKFLKWVNHENDMERQIMTMLTDIKNELSELRMLVKLIEKGQSTIYMMLVGVIVVLGIVVIVWIAIWPVNVMMEYNGAVVLTEIYCIP